MTIFYNANQEPVEKPSGEKVFWRMTTYPVVFSDDGKVLMIKSNFTSKYEFPGGRIEIEESLNDGMARECYEETGYRINMGSVIPINSSEQFFWGHISKKFYHSVILFYEAKLVSSTQDLEAINSDGNEETEKVEWMDLGELSEKNCHAMHLPTAKLLIDRKGSNAA
jgi:8-oxo-dGTP pyrophosphatase MutT (NUDIX family)